MSPQSISCLVSPSSSLISYFFPESSLFHVSVPPSIPASAHWPLPFLLFILSTDTLDCHAQISQQNPEGNGPLLWWHLGWPAPAQESSLNRPFQALSVTLQWQYAGRPDGAFIPLSSLCSTNWRHFSRKSVYQLYAGTYRLLLVLCPHKAIWEPENPSAWARDGKMEAAQLGGGSNTMAGDWSWWTGNDQKPGFNDP